MYFYDYSNIRDLLPGGWRDSTYGNDMCPSFEYWYPPMKIWLKLWADYPEASGRETEIPRFGIYVYTSIPNKDPHSELFDVQEIDEMLGTTPLIESELFEDILVYINSVDMILDAENLCMENNYEC